jgi:hypothetical protein
LGLSAVAATHVIFPVHIGERRSIRQKNYVGSANLM